MNLQLITTDLGVDGYLTVPIRAADVDYFLKRIFTLCDQSEYGETNLQEGTYFENGVTSCVFPSVANVGAYRVMLNVTDAAPG